MCVHAHFKVTPFFAGLLYSIDIKDGMRELIQALSLD
jgi:hypothetical protein